MNLYRTSNLKRRNSFAFLSNNAQQAAVLAHLEKKSWIDEIFARPLPIQAPFNSRFAPVGYNRNVFYASEKKGTTFFEYGYGLLKKKSVVGLGISAVCFEVLFNGNHKPVDVSQSPNLKAILDLHDYTAAHAWLLSQAPPPEAVRYPSVRDPAGGGINFAVYERQAVITTSIEPEDLILTPQANGVVDVLSLTRGVLPSIRPIM